MGIEYSGGRVEASITLVEDDGDISDLFSRYGVIQGLHTGPFIDASVPVTALCPISDDPRVLMVAPPGAGRSR